MRFCSCSRDIGLGGNIEDESPPSNEHSDSHGELSMAMNFATFLQMQHNTLVYFVKGYDDRKKRHID